MGGTVVWRKSKVQSPKSRVQSQTVSGQPRAAPVAWVQIEVLSETERRITYEDPGA